MSGQALVIENFHPPSVANGPHGHWRAAASSRKRAKEFVGLHVRAQGLRPMQGRVLVTALFVYPRRYRTDADNLAARLKPALDALVSAGVLADDSTEHVELRVMAGVERGRKAFVLRLEPAPASEAAA